MKKIFVITSLFLSLVLVSSNLFAFSLKSVTKAVGGDSNVSAQVDKVLKLSDDSTQQFNNALLTLNNLLSTKEEKAQLKAKKESLAKDAKSSETNAIAGEVLSDAASNLEAISQEKDLSERISKLSDEQKAQAGDCVYNIVLANLNFVSLVNESTNLVNAVAANPTAAIGIDVAKLKTVATNTPKQVSLSAKSMAAAIKLLKSSKIKFTEPKTATDSAKSIPDFNFDEE